MANLNLTEDSIATNIQTLPVGSTTAITNADGSMTFVTVQGRQSYDLRIAALFGIALVVLIIFLLWFGDRKKS